MGPCRSQTRAVDAAILRGLGDVNLYAVRQRVLREHLVRFSTTLLIHQAMLTIQEYLKEQTSTEQNTGRRFMHGPVCYTFIVLIGRQRLLARIASGCSVSNKVAAWQARRQLSGSSGQILADADLLVALRRMQLDVVTLLISYRRPHDYHQGMVSTQVCGFIAETGWVANIVRRANV